MKCLFFSIVFLLSSLLFAHCFADTNVIDQVCKAYAGDITEPFNSCVAIFKSDPKSVKATTIYALGVTSLEHLIAKGTLINSNILQLLKDPKTLPAVKEALQRCSSSFTLAEKFLKEGFKGYLSKEYEEIYAELETVILDVQPCADGFDREKLTNCNTRFCGITLQYKYGGRWVGSLIPSIRLAN
ncbi:Pectinesterase inhibitor domain [Dillenia turbinata]|uniref:Pectinesterase inhibitor domain n=1 Tax=Dillenia turbinata TaxID=194707 RepID=A0AAN8V477_9MAGN